MHVVASGIKCTITRYMGEHDCKKGTIGLTSVVCASLSILSASATARRLLIGQVGCTIAVALLPFVLGVGSSCGLYPLAFPRTQQHYTSNFSE